MKDFRSAHFRRTILKRCLLLLTAGLVVGIIFQFLESSDRNRSSKLKAHLPNLQQPQDDGTENPDVMMKADAPEKPISADEASRQHFLHRHRKNMTADYPLSYVTVVVMSYPKSSRFHLLEQIIAKCSTWDFVWEIILVWNGDRSQLPEKIASFERKLPSKGAVEDGKEVSKASPNYHKVLMESRVRSGVPYFTVLPQELNRVDNRWRIASYVDTESVLNMDDDINLFKSGAQCMFDVWRTSPSSLVAIDVRSHFAHTRQGPFGPFGYVARDRSSGFKQYSIALPRSLLTSREYYEAYDDAWRQGQLASAAVKGVKQIVDELYCDDIAFNFVAANTSLMSNTQLPGGHVIYVKAKYAAYPESHSADGMTKMEGMKAMRQKCVNELSSSIGKGEALLRHRAWHVLCEVDG